ncbi:hypothetical protein H5410_061627 [Solanum commersonii]|uniref:Uncharacterized protein n=1 Tax=Solanum commersonii TaxID=4109 RepID=A0A9J5W8D8_SOLCO|nr:hypothetical protein H5410_061627 [Solanum commersonii]
MPINNFTMKSQASSGKIFRSETKLVIPESRFGSFLPARFQTNAEDKGDESDSWSVQLEPYETGSYQLARRLQCSEEDSASQPTLLEKPAYEGNMEVDGKQAEEKKEEPQFQEVKKKKRINKRQKAPQPRYDWKAQ